jgi:hypothetical protein
MAPWVTIPFFPNHLRSIATHRPRRPDQLFEFPAQLRIAAIDFLLGDSPEKGIARLPDALGDPIDLMQQIVRDLDLDLGHLARVSRGFG